MESQLFIYQESTSLVKPAVTPLAVKKAPMKAFPVSNARSITSSGSTSKVGSSKAAVATATTKIEKRKEDFFYGYIEIVKIIVEIVSSL